MGSDKRYIDFLFLLEDVKKQMFRCVYREKQEKSKKKDQKMHKYRYNLD